MSKSPKVSYEEKIMEEFDEKWGWYLQGIITERATDYKTEIQDFLLKKIRAVRKDTLEGLEREVKLLKTGLVDAQDDTVDEVLSLISGMKGGKE